MTQQETFTPPPITLDDLSAFDRQRFDRICRCLSDGIAVHLFEKDSSWVALTEVDYVTTMKAQAWIEKRPKQYIGVYILTTDITLDDIVSRMIDDLQFEGVLMPKYSYQLKCRRLENEHEKNER